MGGNQDEHQNPEMGRERANFHQKEQERECGEIFRCAQEKDKSQQIDEVHGQKQEIRTGGQRL